MLNINLCNCYVFLVTKGKKIGGIRSKMETSPESGKKEQTAPTQTTTEMHGTYPVLPLKNTVVFPGLVTTLNVGEPRSKRLISELKGSKLILATLKDVEKGVGDPHNVFSVGTLARIMHRAENENLTLLIVQGLHRVQLNSYTQIDPYFKSTATTLEPDSPEEDIQDSIYTVKELGKRIVKEIGMPADAIEAIDSLKDPGSLADMTASTLNLEIVDKQRILETLGVKERLERLIPLMTQELQKISIKKDIAEKVNQGIEKNQKEFYLRQQLKAIQEELGDEDGQSEIEELIEKVKAAGMPPEAEETALKEIKRLSKIHTSSAEYTVARTYISWLIDMPWSKVTTDNEDLAEAEETLRKGHYGLEKVKTRILEYLAVKKLKKDLAGPILCFVGPPGVGKTSIAHSVADALGRKFVRLSLGGIRDEAEIRGHRRTYIGALPGRIIQSIKKGDTQNPVILLDEIDKLGYDYRGDPSSALLEVLDPEQNSTFSDHYLEVPYDLSRVLFITTANRLDTVPPPLKDRLEIIEFPGYTEEEKLMIAKNHLIPRQIERHGLKDAQVIFDDEAVLGIIECYTREAGVRNLEREITRILRAVARKVAEDKSESIEICKKDLDEYLGPEKFYSEVKERTMTPGVATGLAWTPTGGEILFIESNLMPGKKGLILTGQLGDVMKESAQAALSYVKAHAKDLEIDDGSFEGRDIHIHVPAGAIPKDGPSAGVAITTALVSLFKNRTVKNDIAMTGEVTLKGKVLPVGGIKEKILGASRAGIDTVYLSKRNEKDLRDIPPEVKDKMKFRFVETVDEILKDAFTAELMN